MRSSTFHPGQRAMMAFTGLDIARGAAFAFGHPIQCVLLRQPDYVPGKFEERRVYFITPNGNTSYRLVRTAKEKWRAALACARLRASDYYRWWVKAPEVEVAA